MNEEKKSSYKTLKTLSTNKIEQLISKALSDECNKSHGVSIDGIEFFKPAIKRRGATMQIKISWDFW